MRGHRFFLYAQRSMLAVLAITVMLASFGIDPAEAARKKKSAPYKQPDRQASIVIEASTGYVLSAQNPDKKLYPASLTKMMTLYLAFDAVAEGRLSRNEYVLVSKHASRQEPSSLGLRPGQEIRVEDLIYSLVTKSANDSAVVLAEAIGGTESRFARMMTAKARQLGMKNTTFVNASGLFKKEQVSTARDMAILSQALIRNHSRHYHYFGTKVFSYKGNNYTNHNRLMNTYRGMDGLKTGYVYASGYNLAASATRYGTRLIGVVFGGKTAQSRNNTMAKLLDENFSRLRDIRVSSLEGQDESRYVTSNGGVSIKPVQVAAITPAYAESQSTPAKARAEKPVTHQVKLQFKPQTLNTHPVEGVENSRGGWAIQIGAFASRDASLKAIAAAKQSLGSVIGDADAIAAPLMTKRGMIYRARLSGMERNNAAQACRILKGSCLILTAD